MRPCLLDAITNPFEAFYGKIEEKTEKEHYKEDDVSFQEYEIALDLASINILLEEMKQSMMSLCILLQ
jgi:hypothetical protein